jgi:hypothetical protein
MKRVGPPPTGSSHDAEPSCGGRHTDKRGLRPTNWSAINSASSFFERYPARLFSLITQHHEPLCAVSSWLSSPVDSSSSPLLLSLLSWLLLSRLESLLSLLDLSSSLSLRLRS